MNWKQYEELAMRTNSEKVGLWTIDSLNFIHGAAGLLTEIKEWQEAEDKLNAEEELGDCAWFIALSAKALGVKDISAVKPSAKSEPLFSAGIDLLDIAKRWFAYGILKDEHKEQAVDILARIMRDLCLRDRHLVSNIEKLKARYPEGFTQEKADSRDKEAEYDSIKKVI